jgi:hypothetical protein
VNRFAKFIYFLGGANLDILLKCPTEKNGFIAIGISIINMVVMSVLTMVIALNSTLVSNMILTVLISLFYGFIIFIGYWGIISVIRKRAAYSFIIKIFSFLAIVVMSLVLAYTIEKTILKNDFSLSLNPSQYAGVVFSVVFSMIIYLIPVILKTLINSSPYQEEQERLEYNFIAQKEADIVAYREKYQGYAKVFNDTIIKMNSIKQLGDISKKYHDLIENAQRETFNFINKLDKTNQNENILLNECKSSVEEQFKVTLEKMSKIFSSI